MNKDILVIAFFFKEEDGVGALRSITLNNFLNQNGIATEVIDKSFIKGVFSKSILLWTVAVFFKILISKYKKVYISCGPFQHLLAISLVCFITRKELIIDFRDPWSLNIKRGYGRGIKVNKTKLKVAELIEKFSYKVCTSFIVCTKGMHSEYQKLFNDGRKLHIITNGFDFELVKDSLKEETTKIDVVCLGKFAEYGMEKSISILKKIKEIANGNEELTIHFIGSDEVMNKQVLDETNLTSNAIFYPRMKYKDALEIASKCNLSILAIRDEEIEYGTKVFDYIGLNLFIVDCFSETSNFKREFQSFLFSPENKKINNYDERIEYHRNSIYSKNIEIFK